MFNHHESRLKITHFNVNEYSAVFSNNRHCSTEGMGCSSFSKRKLTTSDESEFHRKTKRASTKVGTEGERKWNGFK